MTTIFPPNLVRRSSYWTAWKAIYSLKGSPFQYEDDGTLYTIWTYDGPEIHICQIWKDTVPSVMIPLYSQAQNDADKADFESNYQSKGNRRLVSDYAPPFAAKVLPGGSKLYRRVHGISANLTTNTQNIDFVIPYTKSKITGIQLLNAKIGDVANFKVLDTAAGLITTIPFYELNQYGFNVNMIPDEASYPSKYDADLIGGMVLRVEYDATNGGSLPRNIYINFDLHEVVD